MIEQTYMYMTLRARNWYENKLRIALKAMEPKEYKIKLDVLSEFYLAPYIIEIELSDDMERFIPVLDMVMQERF